MSLPLPPSTSEPETEAERGRFVPSVNSSYLKRAGKPSTPPSLPAWAQWTTGPASGGSRCGPT